MLIEIALGMLRASISTSELNERESWTRHYWDWAIHHLSRRHPRGCEASENALTKPTALPCFEELCDRIDKVNPVGRLYVAVARNLAGLLKGETNPLELLIPDNILKNYYETLTNYRCAASNSELHRSARASKGWFKYT